MAKVTEYLGDGVYATWDGYRVWLDCRAQQGLSPGPDGQPSIALDEHVFSALVEFLDRIRQAEGAKA